MQRATVPALEGDLLGQRCGVIIDLPEVGLPGAYRYGDQDLPLAGQRFLNVFGIVGLYRDFLADRAAESLRTERRRDLLGSTRLDDAVGPTADFGASPTFDSDFQVALPFVLDDPGRR